MTSLFPHQAHEEARAALAVQFSRIAASNISKKARDEQVEVAIKDQVDRFGDEIVAGALRSLMVQMSGKVGRG